MTRGTRQKETNVAVYARVSTVGKGQDVDMQLRDLRSYTKARGWQIQDEYVDRGQSGAKDRRPELDRLLNDARKRKVDLILCWRLDRWGRSLKHLILSLDELQAMGVGFVSYSENIDLTTPTGRLMVQLLGAFAEFERNVIRERVVAGLSHAKTKGVKLGRPGADLDMDKLTEMKKRGLTLRAIANELGVSLGLVHKSLRKSCSPDLDKSGSATGKAVFI